MVSLTERAQLALNSAPQPLRSKLEALLQGLEAGELPDTWRGQKLRPSISGREVWVARADEATRVLYSISGEDVAVLDIVDRRKY